MRNRIKGCRFAETKTIDMEFKGTKGEWELSEVNGEIITTEDTNISRIFAMESNEGQANAKLIAAAKDLLNAAINARDLLESKGIRGDAVNGLNLAITKALQ